VIKLEDFVAGGYSLTCPVPIPDFLVGELLPPTILSAGQCTAGTPGIVHWAGGHPEKLGVPENRVEALNQWADLAFQKVFGFPDTFYTLTAARDFVSQFIPEPPEDLMILCAVLPRDTAEEFIRTEKKDVKIGERGIYESLALREAPIPGGTVLGYEPMCYDFSLDHTWLCYELHTEAAKRWNIKPNALGFIDIEEDAQKVVDLANELGAGNGWWLPWLILRYSALTSVHTD
jgi:hypothetical protein